MLCFAHEPDLGHCCGACRRTSCSMLRGHAVCVRPPPNLVRLLDHGALEDRLSSTRACRHSCAAARRTDRDRCPSSSWFRHVAECPQTDPALHLRPHARSFALISSTPVINLVGSSAGVGALMVRTANRSELSLILPGKNGFCVNANSSRCARIFAVTLCLAALARSAVKPVYLDESRCVEPDFSVPAAVENRFLNSEGNQ